MRKSALVLLGVVVSAGFASMSFAEEAKKTENTADVNHKVDVLAEEVEKLKAGQELFPTVDEGKYGFAPAASKVYNSKRGVSLGGYGEFLFKAPSSEDESGAPSGRKVQVDAVRAILYTGYKFNDSILFNSEIEFEHASTETNGSVTLEFGYLDFLYKDWLNFRAGLLLMPMGLINELHEPPVFFGNERPITEHNIIPATWGEIGAGFFGAGHGFTYRTYLTTSLDGAAAQTGGYDSSGIRESRQGGSEALGEDLGFVARVDYEPTNGVQIGASNFVGGADQGQLDTTGASFSGLTNIFEGHTAVNWKGINFRALIAHAHIKGADKINQVKALTGTESVGEDLLGYYIQTGYDVLRNLNTEQQLIPFFRYEWVDTQLNVPAGFLKDPANRQKIYTIGASYKPILNIVVKADYQWFQNRGNTGVNEFNLGLGYLF